MPRVQFVHQTEGINKTVSMPIPKRMARTEAWLDAARKVIPEIPKVGQESRWTINESVVTLQSVMFKLFHRDDRVYASVVIDRRSHGVGG